MTSQQYLNYIYYFTGGGVVLESEYQALLDKATTDGDAKPSRLQQLNQNTLLKSLKTDGIFAKLDGLWVFATNGDSDFATYNWIDSSKFQATKVSSPTFTTNVGFNGDGTSSHVSLNLDTTSSDVTKYTQNSASFGVYSWDDIESSDNFYPISQSSRIRLQRRTATTNNRINNALPSDTQDIGTSGTGLIGLNRTTSATYNGLASNGTLTANITGNSIALNQSSNFVINRFDTTFKSGRIGLCWVGQGLTSTEWSNFVTHVNTYIATL